MIKKIIEFIKELIRKMRKVLGFACICLIVLSSAGYAWNSTANILALSQTTTADATALVNTKGMKDLMVYIYYDETDTDGLNTVEATATIYGAVDDGTTYRYKIGFAPALTGTRDTDGAITFTADTNTAYEIPGEHQALYIDWNMTASGTASAVSRAYIIGKEF